MPAERHAHFQTAATAASQAGDALDAFCVAERIPFDAAWPLQVALDEIVTNIVTHSVSGPTARGFDVWFRRDGECVEIVFADDGPAFDPLTRPSPDVTLPAQDRKPGGLGIMLVKALMDDVRYERTTRNILTIRKRIDTGGAPGGAGPDEHPADRG